MYGFEALTFNIHGGYLEAIVRGHRSALLTASDYNNLCQCETLEDIKMHLSAIEYGPYLQKWKKSLLLRIEVRSPEEKYGRYFQKTSEKYVATFRRQVWSSLLSRRREIWLSLQFGLPHAFLNGGGLC